MKRLLCMLACAGLAVGCSDEPITSPLTPGDARFSIQDANAPVVNTLIDGDDGSCDALDLEAGTDCTLREAIAYASAGATITFAPGLTGTITLAGSQLLIGKDLDLAGPGAGVLAVSGAYKSRVFEVGADATVRISGLTIRDGRAADGDAADGGGLRNGGTALLSGVVVRENRAWGYGGAVGGGIANYGVLTLENCSVTDNLVDAALYLAGGGGIHHTGEGTLTLIGSTVARNYITTPSNSVYGGGIYGTAPIMLVNSTVADNGIEWGSYVYGAGICLRSSPTSTATLSLTNSTVSGNWARGTTAQGSGLYLSSGTGGSTAVNSLVAGNRFLDPGDWGSSSSGPDVRADAALFTATHSLIGDAVGHSIADEVDGNIVGVTEEELLLGALADNGGPTATMALLPGSAAIDAGIAVGCPATDQRGELRPRGGGCDIGAFEFQAYSFSGFFTPVQNPPVLNEVKAGRAVPLNFNLDGDQGLAVLASGYPTSEEFACDGGSVTSEVTETATAGQSGLSYDPLTDTYTYVWKTEKAWANSCRRLTLRLSDEAGTTRTAEFRFVK